MNFLLYGTLAEIFARKAGFNRGLGGSMHAFFPPFGSMPNNAIVGGSADIAVGAALFKRINRKPGIVDRQHRRRLDGLRPGLGGHVLRHDGPVQHPLGSTASAAACRSSSTSSTTSTAWAARPSARPWASRSSPASAPASTPSSMHAERVDGYNPLAVVDAIARKKKILERGQRARSCSTPSPTASPATRPPTPPATARKEEVEALADSTTRSTTYARVPRREQASPARPSSTTSRRQVDERLTQGRQAWPSNDEVVRAARRQADCHRDASCSPTGKVETHGRRASPSVLHAAWRRTRASSRSPSKARSAFDDEGQARLQEQGLLSYRDALFEAILAPLLHRPDAGRPTARRTATGAAPSPSTAASPRPCPTTACSTRPSPRAPSSAPPSATPSRAAAPSSS